MGKLLLSSVEQLKVILPNQFVVIDIFIGVKCIIFWHDRVLRVCDDVYVSDQRIVIFPANRNRNRFEEPTSVRIGIGIVHEFQNLQYRREKLPTRFLTRERILRTIHQ